MRNFTFEVCFLEKTINCFVSYICCNFVSHVTQSPLLMTIEISPCETHQLFLFYFLIITKTINLFVCHHLEKESEVWKKLINGSICQTSSKLHFFFNLQSYLYVSFCASYLLVFIYLLIHEVFKGILNHKLICVLSPL